MKVFILITFALLNNAYAQTSRSCQSTAPAKKRFVVSINGISDQPNYANSVRSVSNNIAPGSKKHFVLQETHDDQYVGHKWKSNEVVNDFTNDELKDAAKAISEATDSNPDETELLIFVTNHGQKSNLKVSGTNDHAISTQSDYVGDVQIRNFIKSLPKNIRIKTVLGQCYSQEIQDSILSAISETGSDTCICGVARGDRDVPTDYNVTDNLEWEGSVAKVAGEKTVSLLEASILASKNQKYTQPNAVVSTSERLMFDVLMRQQSDVKNTEQLEQRAANILADVKEQIKNKKIETVIADEIRNIREERIVNAANVLNLSDSVNIESIIFQKINGVDSSGNSYDKKSSTIYAAIQKSILKRIEAIEKECNDTLNGIWNTWVKDIKPKFTDETELGLAKEEHYDNPIKKIKRQCQSKADQVQVEEYSKYKMELDPSTEIAAKVMARAKLEEAFLLSPQVSKTDKEKFMAFRRCERQQLGPGPEKIKQELQKQHQGK